MKYLIEGKVHKFADDITADYIIAGKHRAKAENVLDLKNYVFHEIRPSFAQTVKQGDVIVAGENFGCGSSREHAATLIQASGIEAIVAKSFARIFYRNAVNNGLPVIICDTDEIHEGERLKIDLEQGTIKNLANGKTLLFQPIPSFLKEIYQTGGLVNYLKSEDGK